MISMEVREGILYSVACVCIYIIYKNTLFKRKGQIRLHCEKAACHLSEDTQMQHADIYKEHDGNYKYYKCYI